VGGSGDEAEYGRGTGAGRWPVPEWELLVHTPAVFVRVANTEVTGYGTWKSVRKTGDREKHVEPLQVAMYEVGTRP